MRRLAFRKERPGGPRARFATGPPSAALGYVDIDGDAEATIHVFYCVTRCGTVSPFLMGGGFHLPVSASGSGE
jgi:hypothetical protein